MIEKFSQIGYLRKDALFKLNFKNSPIINFDADNKDVFIIGDLHQDDESLIDILKATQFFEKDDVYLIFLGDYIDRGGDKFLINKLLVLKYYFKDRVILLRGNHEISPKSELIPPMLREYDFFNYLEFLKEENYVDDEMIGFYHNLFENLPILVNVKFNEFNLLLVHGGIPRFDFKRGYPKNIEDFFFLNSPINVSYINDFLWNDFAKFQNFSSQIRYNVSKKETEYFLYKFNYDYIIRAHEAVKEGYKIDYSRVITLFSNGNSPKSYYAVDPKILHLNTKTIFSFKGGVLKPEKTLIFSKFSKKFALEKIKKKKKFQVKKFKIINLVKVTELYTGNSTVLEKDKLQYKFLDNLYGVDVKFKVNFFKRKEKRLLKYSPLIKNHFVFEILDSKPLKKYVNIKYSFFNIKEIK